MRSNFAMADLLHDRAGRCAPRPLGQLPEIGMQLGGIRVGGHPQQVDRLVRLVALEAKLRQVVVLQRIGHRGAQADCRILFGAQAVCELDGPKPPDTVARQNLPAVILISVIEEHETDDLIVRVSPPGQLATTKRVSDRRVPSA
jgi:hypothetical protein